MRLPKRVERVAPTKVERVAPTKTSPAPARKPSPATANNKQALRSAPPPTAPLAAAASASAAKPLAERLHLVQLRSAALVSIYGAKSTGLKRALRADAEGSTSSRALSLTSSKQLSVRLNGLASVLNEASSSRTVQHLDRITELEGECERLREKVRLLEESKKRQVADAKRLQAQAKWFSKKAAAPSKKESQPLQRAPFATQRQLGGGEGDSDDLLRGLVSRVKATRPSAQESRRRVAPAAKPAKGAPAASDAITTKFEHEDTWNATAWVDSLEGLDILLANALVQPLDLAGANTSLQQLAFFRAIGRLPADDAKKVVLRLFEQADVVSALTNKVVDALECLSVAKAASAAEMQTKFVTEEAGFTLTYGSTSVYHGGLEGVVGVPSPHLMEGLQKEHCSAYNADAIFTSANYSVRTTPRTEFWFVMEPERGVPSRSQAVLGIGTGAWPAEGAKAPFRRKAEPLEKYRTKLAVINRQLAEEGCAPMLPEELIGARLYTGPMFAQYNAVLRGHASADSDGGLQQYTTTLHVICSAIVKLSKLTKATKVYRGVSRGILPESFWVKNSKLVRGGVELAFMSCTLNRDVALTYASLAGDDNPSLVIEISQGMIDRGARLDWLSQYPEEVEVVWTPLTALEVERSRVDKSVLVVEASAKINSQIQPIEHYVQRRLKLLTDLNRNTLVEVMQVMLLAESSASKRKAAGAMLSKLFQEQILDPWNATSLNDDENFVSAVSQAMALKHTVLSDISEARSLREQLESTTEVVLDGIELHDAHVMLLCDWLADTPPDGKDRSLDLRRAINLTTAAVARIAEALAKSSLVERLRVDHDLELNVQKLRTGDVIELKRKTLSDFDIAVLSTILKSNKALRVLDLSYSALPILRVKLLFQAIASIRFSKLVLYGCQLYDSCTASLCSLITEHGVLSELDLSKNNFEMAGIEEIVKAAASKGCSVAWVGLARQSCDVSDEDRERLTRMATAERALVLDFSGK